MLTNRQRAFGMRQNHFPSNLNKMHKKREIKEDAERERVVETHWTLLELFILKVKHFCYSLALFLFVVSVSILFLLTCRCVTVDYSSSFFFSILSISIHMHIYLEWANASVRLSSEHFADTAVAVPCCCWLLLSLLPLLYLLLVHQKHFSIQIANCLLFDAWK